MMHDRDDQLAAWLSEPLGAEPDTALDRALDVTRRTRQLPGWLVTGGTIDARPGGGVLQFGWALIAVVAMLAVLTFALVVGGVLSPDPQPTPLVIASSTPAPSGSIGPAPSSESTGTTLVYYTEYVELSLGDPGCSEENVDLFDSCISTRIWVANSDGTGARELFPESVEDRQIEAVAPDGRYLIYAGYDGSGPQSAWTYHLATLARPGPIAEDVTVLSRRFDSGVCVPFCGGEFTFSADSSRLAFVLRTRPAEADFDYEDPVIATLDVATGEVVELESTASSAPNGNNGAPRWAPDSSRLVFTRSEIGPATEEDPLEASAMFVVDADGGNLREVVGTDLEPTAADWAPDGSHIVFTSALHSLAIDPQLGTRDMLLTLQEIYSVRPDGTDLHRLTDDTAGIDRDHSSGALGAAGAVWARDGGILFTRTAWDDAGDGDPRGVFAGMWRMDADGGNQREVDSTDLAALTAAGCDRCPFPPETALGTLYSAYWRPAP